MTEPQPTAADRALDDKQAVLAHLFAPWDGLPDPAKYQRRHSARYMTLAPRTLSAGAEGLVAALMSETIIPFKQSTLATPLRPTTLSALSVALGIWLHELLAAANRGLWVQHTMRSDGFKRLAIGWQAFSDVRGALERAGLIVGVKGRWDQGRQGAKQYVPPIFRPSPRLLEIAAEHGVTPWAVGLHFRDGDGVIEDGADGPLKVL